MTQVEIQVNVDTPCVHSSENSCRAPMKNTVDELTSGSLKCIMIVIWISALIEKKKNLGLSGSRTRDLSHPKRESYH